MYKISVCMATYNGARFIKQQIDSILMQLSPEDELIVSDDGSEDDTLSIVLSYSDKRIKIVHHSEDYTGFIPHEKAASNFGNVVKYATGDYIFLADQDDIWLPQKVELICKALENTDIIVHNYQVINEKDTVITNCEFRKNPLHNSIFLNVVDSHFRGCCMAFKSEFLKYVLPFPKKVIGHDYWMGVIITHFGKLSYIYEPLIKYRLYSESVSFPQKTTLLYKIKFRIKLLLQVSIRILRIYIQLREKSRVFRKL